MDVDEDQHLMTKDSSSSSSTMQSPVPDGEIASNRQLGLMHQVDSGAVAARGELFVASAQSPASATASVSPSASASVSPLTPLLVAAGSPSPQLSHGNAKQQKRRSRSKKTSSRATSGLVDADAMQTESEPMSSSSTSSASNVPARRALFQANADSQRGFVNNDLPNDMSGVNTSKNGASHGSVGEAATSRNTHAFTEVYSSTSSKGHQNTKTLLTNPEGTSDSSTSHGNTARAPGSPPTITPSVDGSTSSADRPPLPLTLTLDRDKSLTPEVQRSPRRVSPSSAPPSRRASPSHRKALSESSSRTSQALWRTKPRGTRPVTSSSTSRHSRNMSTPSSTPMRASSATGSDPKAPSSRRGRDHRSPAFVPQQSPANFHAPAFASIFTPPTKRDGGSGRAHSAATGAHLHLDRSRTANFSDPTGDRRKRSRSGGGDLGMTPQQQPPARLPTFAGFFSRSMSSGIGGSGRKHSNGSGAEDDGASAASPADSSSRRRPSRRSSIRRSSRPRNDGASAGSPADSRRRPSLAQAISALFYPPKRPPEELSQLREDRRHQAQKVWEQRILPNWDREIRRSRTSSLVWDGIPPRVRGKVWQKLIGNPLCLTPELFKILSKRSKEYLAELHEYQNQSNKWPQSWERQPIATESDADDASVSSAQRPKSMSRFPPPPRRKKLSTRRNSLSSSEERKSIESERKAVEEGKAVMEAQDSASSEDATSSTAGRGNTEAHTSVEDVSADQGVKISSQGSTDATALLSPPSASMTISDTCSVISDLSELSLDALDTHFSSDSVAGASTHGVSTSAGLHVPEHERAVSNDGSSLTSATSSSESSKFGASSSVSGKPPLPHRKAPATKAVKPTDSSPTDISRRRSKKPKPKEDGKEASVQIIELDIGRTFPELQFFHPPDGPLYEPLLEILASHAVHRPDIGYVQGMSYIAAMLLLTLDPNLSRFDCFVAFSNIIHKYENFSLFRMGNFDKNVDTLTFKALLKQHLPDLDAHLAAMDLAAEMYLFGWWIPIFASCLPLDTSVRLWDNYLYRGHLFLFRASLGILKFLRPKLLVSTFEECMAVLTHLQQVVAEEELFASIQSVDLSERAFAKVRAQIKQRIERMP